MDDLTSFRRLLHANPELSGEEKETQKRIMSFLNEYGIDNGKEVGKYGLLYPFHFGEGPHLLIRVDIDALPIQEINSFEHKSIIEGVSHKCGHDGHTTIGIGLALKFKQNPLDAGKVTILFQPAEEIGEGAQGILGDSTFKCKDYDYAVALHNIPGQEMHSILWKKDNFTPAVKSLIIRLQGKTSHAAEPLKGFNPSYAISEIIQTALEQEETDEEHKDYNLITPVFAEIGSKDYGISAGYGEIHFTIRSWRQERLESTTEAFLSAVNSIAKKHHLTIETEFLAEFASNQNDHFVVDQIIKSGEVLGLNVVSKKEPFPWGEDFGLFTQKIPGAMFGLGSGINTPALHNPDYDYPDEITETGVNLFYEIAKNITDSV
jgi:amidohydrolase